MPYKDPIKQREWAREHRDSVRASQKRWAERNKELVLAKHRAQYAADPKKFSRWAEANPEKALRSKLRNSAHTRAKKLGLPFDLARDDIVIPEFCPVLGIRLSRSTVHACDNSPSLDRVVPELGYVLSNVRVISLRANIIKSFGTALEHRKIAEYIEREI